MSRRARFSNEPSDERASPLTPDEMTRQEFGRHLQKLLDERNWNQSDLAREIARVTGKPERRDAISTYINGRSFPSVKTVGELCRALNISREELLPNTIIHATQAEHPAFEMRAAAGHPGRAWIRLNRMMSFETATRIAQLISDEDTED